MSVRTLIVKDNIVQLNGVAVSVGNGTSGTGVLRVTIASDSTGNIATIGTSVTPGVAAGNLGKAEDAAHVSGDTGVAVWTVRDNATSGQPTTAFGANGDYAPFVVDDNYRLYVQGVGNIASDGVDAGAPLKIGGKAVTADITAVSTADRVDAIFDTLGKQVVMPYAIKENFIKGSANATNTTSTSVIATAGSGVKNYITNISISNTGATTSLITLQDGSGGTTLWQSIAPAGGGSNIHFPVPIATSANTALFFAAGSSSTTIYVSASGYKSV